MYFFCYLHEHLALAESFGLPQMVSLRISPKDLLDQVQYNKALSLPQHRVPPLNVFLR